jgi:hypothetical protein
MAYTLERFGGIVLPPYNRQTSMPPVQPRTALVATAAGVFDAWGADRAPQQFPQAITLTCILYEEVAATWRSSVDALRAAVGTRATLYRKADDNGDVHRCPARLIDMAYTRATKHIRHQELRLTFQQLDQWEGKRWENWALDDGHALDDGMALDSGAIVLVPGGPVNVGGNLPARNVVVSFTIGGSGISNLQIIVDPGVVLSIVAPLTAGDVYAIDAAARTATKNGADAYGKIDLDTADHNNPTHYHLVNEWISIPPGSPIVLLQYDSSAGAVTGTLVFAEAWA